VAKSEARWQPRWQPCFNNLIPGSCYFDHQFWTRGSQDTLSSAMSSLSDIDLEKGPPLFVRDISVPLPPDSPALPECTLSEEVNVPLPSPPPGEESHLLNYGDRLVFNYLGPRPHYDNTVIQATRIRHMNITRIQHDLLRLQNVLTCPGGGTEENFARLSSLLHEHSKVKPLLSILIPFYSMPTN